MKSMIARAMKIAYKEVATDRKVMVLLPNNEWRSAALSPYTDNIYLRASTIESSLKSVAIDTLILVATDHPEWNTDGEQYAREKLRTSLDPRIITIGE